MKWFDDAKGFGFVASEDGGKDVFVHISILGPAGISHLAEGQQVTMRVVDTPKGREAISLSLWKRPDASERPCRFGMRPGGPAAGRFPDRSMLASPMQPSSDIRRLIEIMAALRDPVAGCPWDVEQTFASIAPFTIEEAYEVADAIERGSPEDLREELGDLLLQVVFHARMAEEAGLFDFGGVVQAITAKLVRRHPHVFGDARAQSPAAVKALWGRIKADEKRAKLEAREATRGPPAEACARARSTAFLWRCRRFLAPSNCRRKPAKSVSTGTMRARSSPSSAKRSPRSRRRSPTVRRSRWRMRSATSCSRRSILPAISKSTPRLRYAAPTPSSNGGSRISKAASASAAELPKARASRRWSSSGPRPRAQRGWGDEREGGEGGGLDGGGVVGGGGS